LQTYPVDVILAYRIFVEHPEFPNCILKGRRVGRNPLDALFTGGMSILSTLLLRKQLSDVNAQPKMFHRDFLDNLTESPTDYSLNIYLLFQARLHNSPILEYPVIFGKRLHGESKGGGSLKGNWKLIRRTLSYMLKLKHDLGR
jgi:dolichol-phosphate mannosyltransferase